MRFPYPVSLSWVASLIGAELLGPPEASATGINEIHRVEPGDLVFVDHPKYYGKCISSAASHIIIDRRVDVPEGKSLLIVPEPFEAYLAIVRHFRPFLEVGGPMGHGSTVGEGTRLMPGVVIGNHVRIGRDCLIHPNVTIRDHCEIGDRVVVQSGSVIGSEPFYYNAKPGRALRYRRMESCGRVLLHDDVEVGAGCTVDRGVTSDTVIGAGTKLDNMVHVGHDTVIGRNCLIAAQVAIAGAVEIGDDVVLWGQVGVNKTLRIGDGAVVLAQSGVPADLAAGGVYFGTPAIDAMEKKRELVWIRRIASLWERVGRIDRGER